MRLPSAFEPVLNSYLTFVASLQHEAVLTAGCAIALLLGAQIVGRVVERGKTPEAKRFWKLTVRNLATAFFVLALFVIWRKELQTLLLALGAATAGFLVAFREQWLSLLAAWVRMVKRPYGLNDFIEVDGVRGRVIDLTLLTTTLAETSSIKEGHSYSGRVIHVPNNRMLLAPLLVDNLTGKFSAHIMKVPLPPNAHIIRAEALLFEAAESHCSPYYKEAEKHMQALQDDEALDTPTVAPRTRILLADEGVATIFVRIVVPFKDRAKVEQAILREFLLRADDNVWPKVVH